MRRIPQQFILCVMCVVAAACKQDQSAPTSVAQPSSDKQAPLIICGGEGSRLHLEIVWPIVEEAYRRIGVPTELKVLPAERSLQMANSTYDAEVLRHIAVLSQFTQLRHVPVVIMKARVFAYTLDESITIHTWEDLTKYRFAFRRGVKIAEEKTAAAPQRLMVSHLDQGLKLLQEQRIDVLVAVEVDFQQSIKETDIQVHGHLLTELDLHHLVHVRHQDLIPQLSSAFESMHAEGLLPLQPELPQSKQKP